MIAPGESDVSKVCSMTNKPGSPLADETMSHAVDCGCLRHMHNQTEQNAFTYIGCQRYERYKGVEPEQISDCHEQYRRARPLPLPYDDILIVERDEMFVKDPS